MKRIEIADLAKNAFAYELDDGRVYRLHMNLITPVDKLATADYVEVETNGYEIDKHGNFVVDDNGEPITLAKQRARIPLANVRAGTDSIKEGWQAQAMPSEKSDPEAYAATVEGAKKLKKLPKTGEQGDKVMVDGTVYAYGLGLYEQVRRQRLAQVAPSSSAPSALDQEAIDALIP